MSNRLSALRLGSTIVLLLAALLHADGFIVVPPDRPSPQPQSAFPLEVRYHRVNVAIEEMTALTSIDQEFYNPSNRRLEGTYIFPIPVGAVIDKFSMFIDGKETPAEMLDAVKARQIYEDIVRRMVDPALLEYNGQGLFKARVFPIEPRSTKRIKISYREALTRENGTIGYLYPLNTEKFSASPLSDVSVKVSITAGDALKNIYSTSHDIDVVRKDPTHAVASFEATKVKPDKDFSLFYTTEKSKFGLSVLTYRQSGEDGFFFMNVSPDATSQDIDDKDITFVLDVSGSMAGPKMDQARKALLFCLANLNKGDRFEVIRFSTEAQSLFGALTPATPENVKKAHAFVEGLQAIGGTNIEEALGMALKGADKESSRRHMVMFMTDGKPTIGAIEEPALLQLIRKANPAQTRIFTLGIGEDLNTHLLDKITEMTKAYRSYVGTNEDLEIKISDLYTKLQSPVLTDVALSCNGSVRLQTTYPRNLPDLFRGSSVTVLGKFSGEGAAQIVLSGKVKGQPVKWTYGYDFPKSKTKNEFIAPLWAARRIGYLLDQLRLHGEEKELVDEVTILAKKYGIITPYTSYLILEDEANQITTRAVSRENEIFRRMAPHASAPVLEKRLQESYSGMKAKSGRSSVDASKDVQDLSFAQNMGAAQKNDDRLNYRDETGRERNITQQVRQVQGRAMYQAGTWWLDPLLQTTKNQKVTRVQFGTQPYFDLVAKKPEASPFLALGRNVRFVVGAEIIEIYE